jgi:hypothetical protein
MSATILREGPFRLTLILARGSTHVPVAHPDGEAKFWIEPDLTTNVVIGLSQLHVAEAQDIVRRHLPEIRDAWVRHFGR